MRTQKRKTKNNAKKLMVKTEVEYHEIGSIAVGDKVHCIFCGKEFVVEKIGLSPDIEYITCPYCKKSADIQRYL